MKVVRTANGLFRRVEFKSEADLESTVVELQADLFGPDRAYLDVKRKIGLKGGLRNVPDGYLLDLSGRKPRLYVVENELSSHDPLRHIAAQVLEFSLSFEDDPHAVRTILFESLLDQPEPRSKCEHYAANNEFRNLDHLLDYLVFESPFSALVIIDEMPDQLESALTRRFQFAVEVMELERYEGPNGERAHSFEPFLADLSEDIAPQTSTARPPRHVDLSDVDTVVVPAREDGFRRVFVGESRWWAIRLHGAMRPQIRHIAAYQVAPISAITHIAPVRAIEPWKDSGKFVVYFSEPPKEIGPIPIAKGGRIGGIQSLRYTTREKLLNAKTIDDIWV